KNTEGHRYRHQYEKKRRCPGPARLLDRTSRQLLQARVAVIHVIYPSAAGRADDRPAAHKYPDAGAIGMEFATYHGSALLPLKWPIAIQKAETIQGLADFLLQVYEVAGPAAARYQVHQIILPPADHADEEPFLSAPRLLH